MLLSIVVPVLNEAEHLPQTLLHLHALRKQGAEVIVVDGGSDDQTFVQAAASRLHAIRSMRGRARQMNAGARVARGDVILFLHADTLLPPTATQDIETHLRDGRHLWGRFNVRIDGRSRLLGIVACLMNWRSCLTGIATGDQAIFITRHAFDAVGGFPDQPLLEDVEISKHLRRLSTPACLRARAITSGRRWESRGVLRTIVLMWKLRWAYWRGTPASELAEAYK